jgi:DNA end-binding protein Ku
MSARSIWKGSISFGLVNIPIKLYSATEDRVFSFNQLCKNGHRIQYKRWCPVEEREVRYDEIQKGYQIAKDNYVVIEKSELNNIKIKTTDTIDIKEFVDIEELDPIFIENSYYIGPDSKSVDKAYSLLVGILKNTDKVAIGKVVLRDREQTVALRAYQRGIVMHILHYLEEIRPLDEIKEISQLASAKVKLEEQELALGKTLVERLSSDDLDLSQYSDTYTKHMHELIDAKIEGKELITAQEVSKPETTKDLVAALKASISAKPSKSSTKRK